jgi:hypothetical protein
VQPNQVIIIGVGGLSVGLEGLDHGLAEHTRRRYAAFLADRAPDLVIEVETGREGPHRPAGPPDVIREGEHLFEIGYGGLDARLDLAAGRGRAGFPSSIWMVDSLLRMSLGLMLVERGGLLVHASGVRLPDGVIVCYGPSGVGKTTVARSVDPESVLCDEMIALVPQGSRVWAHGTPFHGDYEVCAPISGRLVGLVRLVQGNEDALQPLSNAQAAQSLLGSTLFFCRDEALGESLLSTALRTCSERSYRLTFQRGTHVPSFVVQELRRAPLGVIKEDAGAAGRR